MNSGSYYLPRKSDKIGSNNSKLIDKYIKLGYSIMLLGKSNLSASQSQAEYHLN